MRLVVARVSIHGPEAEIEEAAPAHEEVEQEEQHHRELADDRRPGGPGDPQAGREDQQRVESDVEEGAPDLEEDRGFRVAFPGHDRPEAGVEHDEGEPRGGDLEVADREGGDLAAGPQRRHDPPLVEEGGGDDRGGEQETHGDGLAGRVLGRPLVAGPQRARDGARRPGSEPEHHADGEEHHRHVEGQGGQGVPTEHADEEHVGQVVEGVDRHAHHHRHRQGPDGSSRIGDELPYPALALFRRSTHRSEVTQSRLAERAGALRPRPGR